MIDNADTHVIGVIIGFRYLSVYHKIFMDRWMTRIVRYPSNLSTGIAGLYDYERWSDPPPSQMLVWGAGIGGPRICRKSTKNSGKIRKKSGFLAPPCPDLAVDSGPD